MEQDPQHWVLGSQKDKMQKYHCVTELAALVKQLDEEEDDDDDDDDRILCREAKNPTQ